MFFRFIFLSIFVIHAKIIKVDRKYYSTSGWILHYFDEQKIEHWD